MSWITGGDGTPEPASWRNRINFQTLADGIPAVVFICDPGGTCVFANAQVQKATGLSEEAWLGRGWISAIHRDDRVRVARAWGRAITASEPFELEYRIKTASDDHDWYLVRATPVRDNRRVVYWIGHATDINDFKQEVEVRSAELTAEAERKEAERRQAEEFAARLIDANADSIQTLSLDGRLLTTNAAGAAPRTMDLDEVVLGKSWIAGWSTAQSRALAANAVSDAAKGGIGRFSAPFVSAAGERRWWNVAVTPMRGAEGEVQSLLCVSRDVTEGRNALERLELITSTVREGFYISDLETGRGIYSSPAADEIWGRRIADTMHVPFAFLDWVHPDDRPTLQAAIKSEQRGEAVRSTYRILRPDGEIRVVRDLCYPIPDENGRMTRVAGSIEDITEAHRTEEQLKLITETVQEGFYQTDLATGCSLYSSPGCDRILGRSTRILEREPATYLEWVHPVDRQIVRDAMTRERQGEPCRSVYRIVRPNSEIRWVRDLNHPVFDAHGQAVQTVGTFEDITEIKEAEARAEAASQERYRSVFDLAAVGIARVSMEGRVLEANRRFAEILQWPLDALMTVTAQEVAHPADHAEAWKQTQAILRREIASFSIPMRYRTAAGDWVHTRLTVSPVLDGTGEHDHFVSVLVPFDELDRERTFAAA